MIINDNTIKTEAEAYKARVIGDAIVTAFGAHKVNFSDFSNDYSGVYANAGSTIRVPLIGKTGGVKTAHADGTDDFSINTKTTKHVDIELELKYVTAPLTIGEMETGAQLSDWASSLANEVVSDVQKTLENKLLATEGVERVVVGTAEDFTVSTLTKLVRPMVRKPGVAEPVCYLEGSHYASVIPMDKDGFDTNTPHFGFSKIAEYTAINRDTVGIAASQSAVAIATRIPQSLMQNPCYITKYAYQLPELGVNVLYLEWANPSNGTMTAGLFYLIGMEIANPEAAVVLTSI